MDKKRTAMELASMLNLLRFLYLQHLYKTATARKQDVHPCNHAENKQ